MKIIKLALLILFISQFSFAATVTWDADGGDGLWSTATNWSGDAVPTSSDDVVINNGDMVTLSSLTTTVKSLDIDGNSTLTIAISGNLTVDLATGTNAIHINSGSTLDNNGTLTVSSPSNNGIRDEGTFTNDGTTTISDCTTGGTSGLIMNSNTTNSTNANLIISNCSYGISSTGAASNDGTITISNGLVGIYSENNFTVDGKITITGPEDIGVFVANSNFTNNDTLDIQNAGDGGLLEGGFLVMNGTFTNSSSGVTTVSGSNPAGIQHFDGTASTNNAGSLTIGSSTTYGIDQNGGSFTSSGTITGDDEFNLTSGATVGGTLNPGGSPGTASFTGNVSLTGTINTELDGATVDTEYDQVSVTGTATLTGATINVTAGYTPSSTTNYTIVTATSISGTPTVNLPTDAGGITWSQVTGASTIVVTATVALPVELLGFRAITLNNNIELSWETTSEINNDGFEVQHSRNGENWTTLGFIQGAGTIDQVQTYSYRHQQPKGGQHFYRLKQMDFNGGYSYSNVININLEEEGKVFSFAPNPWNASINEEIRIMLNIVGMAKLEIVDVSGKKVYETILSDEKSLLGINQLPIGLYFARLISRNGQFSKKLLVR